MTTAAARGARAESPDQDAVAMPQFLQPQPRRQDSADPETTTLHPAETPQDVRSGHPEDAADAYVDARPAETDGSSLGSTAEPLNLRPLATEAQVKTARTMVEAMLIGATTMVNRRMRQHTADDRWLMSKRERETIASPLARILARRSPVPGGGEDVSDVADGVEAIVGVIAYCIGQMVAERTDQPMYIPPAPAVQDDAPPAATGPGATLSPLDPAYRVG